jgi:hypothetical protein
MKRTTALHKLFFFVKARHIGITYGITVCNEAEELKRLLTVLLPNIKRRDEIIILSDQTKVTPEVLAIIACYQIRIRHISVPLNNDFSAFKNNLIKQATKEYLFQLDADEIPCTILLKQLKSMLYRNKKADCFYIPRVNKVEGFTAEHVKKWNWQVDERHRINFPDYQGRLFKLGKNIQWKNNVHEVLVNYTRPDYFPKDNEDYCLFHPKAIGRQEMQNNYYETLQNNE